MSSNAAGDESDFTWFGARERRAFNGLLSVIVRAKKGAAGPIEIKVSSKGLTPATVTLKTKEGK